MAYLPNTETIYFSDGSVLGEYQLPNCLEGLTQEELKEVSQKRNKVNLDWELLEVMQDLLKEQKVAQAAQG